MFSRIFYSFLALFFAVFMIFSVPVTSMADGHEEAVPEEPGDSDSNEQPGDEEAPTEEGEDGEESPEGEEHNDGY